MYRYNKIAGKYDSSLKFIKTCTATNVQEKGGNTPLIQLLPFAIDLYLHLIYEKKGK